MPNPIISHLIGTTFLPKAVWRQDQLVTDEKFVVAFILHLGGSAGTGLATDISLPLRPIG